MTTKDSSGDLGSELAHCGSQVPLSFPTTTINATTQEEHTTDNKSLLPDDEDDDEEHTQGEGGFIMTKAKRLKNREAQHRYRIRRKAKLDSLEDETTRLKSELEKERQRCHQLELQVATLTVQSTQKDPASIQTSPHTPFSPQLSDEVSIKQATDTLILDIHRHMATCLPFQLNVDSDPHFHALKVTVWELVERMLDPPISSNLMSRLEVPGVKSFGTEDDSFWKQIFLLLGLTPQQRAAMGEWKAKLIHGLDRNYGKQLLSKMKLVTPTNESENAKSPSSDGSAADEPVWSEQRAYLNAISKGLYSALTCSSTMTTAIHDISQGLNQERQMIKSAICTFYFHILSPKQALVLFMNAPLCCWNALALVNSVEKHIGFS